MDRDMYDYRLYPLGDTAHVIGPAKRLEAESDADALRRAAELLDTDALELWRGSQYMATLTRDPNRKQLDCIIVVTA